MRGGRGGGVCSTNNSIYMRGGIGPGRRVLKLGVGGFTVRHTKSTAGGGINSRSLSFGGSSAGFSPQLEDEQGQIEDDKSLAMLNTGVTLGGKPRMRRPRKSRRPQLEDAYPANIQESFFGVAAVESRLLSEQNVEEPLLVEYNKISSNVFDAGKIGTELSEHSAELLRNEQEMDMLDDIPLVDDIGLDMESLDFTDLLVNEEEDVAISSAIAAENIDSLDGFNAGSSSSLLTNNAVEICSPPSASTIRTQSRMQQNNSIESCVTQNTSNIYQTVKESTPKLIEYQRLSAGALAVERWEEDEPLGDKATKAAVLYSNIQHPNLKEKFPLWSDRVRQINKIWRELNPEKRQEFVELARKNRLNCPTPRRRSRRVVINPATQQQQSLEHNTSEISQTGDTSIKIKEEGSLDVAFREELSMTDQLSNQSTGGSCSYSNTTFIGLDKTSEDKQQQHPIQQIIFN
uniref:HMG box domain-containing protein n=1 Tax=Meloidogyne incognita TaxID=6306 RepID=A0A914NLT0_MELIC